MIDTVIAYKKMKLNSSEYVNYFLDLSLVIDNYHVDIIEETEYADTKLSVSINGKFIGFCYPRTDELGRYSLDGIFRNFFKGSMVVSILGDRELIKEIEEQFESVRRM